MPQSGIAGGTIRPMRAVKLSTTVDGRVLESGAGDRSIGISQRGTRRSEYVDTNGNAALVGEPISYFDEGEECFAEYGGTVAAQDLLKVTTNGKLIAATADADWCIAVALSAGADGEVGLVKVQIVQRAS